MAISIPNHIQESGVVDAAIEFQWNDEDPEEAYGDEMPRLQSRIAKITNRGVVALSAGIAEWIAWRFSKLTQDPVLFQFIEATWACIMDWRYTDFERSPNNTIAWEDWEGPVRGPLGAASNLLSEIVETASQGEPVEFETVYMSNLAEYVLNDVTYFREWMKSTIIRLQKHCPFSEDNMLGDPVPREILDPYYDYKPELASELISNYLKDLDYNRNPYLRSPKEMSDAGFTGVPYPN